MAGFEANHDPTSNPARGRWVLLRHDTPDGAWHCDWMLERPGDVRESRLLTFRLDAPPVLDPGARFEGERLADHRTAYLEYEGPVPGDRGHVRRLLRGTLLQLDERPDRIEISFEVGGGVRRVMGQRAEASNPGGEPRADARWKFAVHA